MEMEPVSRCLSTANQIANAHDEIRSDEDELQDLDARKVENASIRAWSLRPGPGLIWACVDPACSRHEEAQQILDSWRNPAVEVVFVEGNEYVN